MLRSPNRSSGFGRSSRPEMVTGNSLSLTDVLDPGCAKTSRGQRPIQDIGTEGNTRSWELIRPSTMHLKVKAVPLTSSVPCLRRKSRRQAREVYPSLAATLRVLGICLKILTFSALHHLISGFADFRHFQFNFVIRRQERGSLDLGTRPRHRGRGPCPRGAGLYRRHHSVLGNIGRLRACIHQWTSSRCCE